MIASWQQGKYALLSSVLGVDEAGRGPLAGPVVAAGVVLNKDRPIDGLNDSKKLDPKTRSRLYRQIMNHATLAVVAVSSVALIDEINILQASLLAMKEVVQKAQKICSLDLVLVDGNQRIPDLAEQEQVCIISGDALIDCIMAASIVAKVHRDRLMFDYDEHYPGYGFANHKGYGTKAHLTALTQLGPCPIHRRSFSPLKNASS